MSSKTELSIIKKFKLGLRRLCARQIWTSVESSIPHTSQEDLANQFELARTDVTKGIDYGALSLDNLLVILSCLDWTYEDLGDLPSLEDRCFAGFAEAVSALPRARKKQIARAEFIATAMLVANQRFQRLCAHRNLTETTWLEVYNEIRPRIAERLACHEGQLPFHTVHDFQKLYVKWGERVARCLMAIPNRWALWLELSI